MKMRGDRSVTKNICTNSFFSGDPRALLEKVLFMYGSVGVMDCLSHYDSPIHKFFISLSCQCPAYRGLGTASLLFIRGRKGEKSILLQQQQNQVVQAQIERSFISAIHYCFIWHTKDCQHAL